MVSVALARYWLGGSGLIGKLIVAEAVSPDKSIPKLQLTNVSVSTNKSPQVCVVREPTPAGSRKRRLTSTTAPALKTGCAFEKRQLTTFDGLVRALAVFVPMAWRLLVLRHLGRAASPPPIGRGLDPEQLLLLRKLLDRRRYHLPSRNERQIQQNIEKFHKNRTKH